MPTSFKARFFPDISQSAIIYGEGPPWKIVPTGEVHLYIDVKDYTGNPQAYTLWGYSADVIEYPGWRPIGCCWKAIYNNEEIILVDTFDWDFVKNVVEQIKVSEESKINFEKMLIQTVEAKEIFGISFSRPLQSIVETQSAKGFEITKPSSANVDTESEMLRTITKNSPEEVSISAEATRQISSASYQTVSIGDDFTLTLILGAGLSVLNKSLLNDFALNT